MVPLAVTLLFVLSAFVTSAFAHDERRWRYPFLAAVACAGILTAWGAQALRASFRDFWPGFPTALAAVVVALPFGLVLWSLLVRRRNTPRHLPSINDDPTLRRHLEEKNRRARRRRQEEEALENSDTPPT